MTKKTTEKTPPELWLMHPITLNFYVVESVSITQSRSPVGPTNMQMYTPSVNTFELELAEDLREKFDLYDGVFQGEGILEGYELFHRDPRLTGEIKILGEIGHVFSWCDRRITGQFR